MKKEALVHAFERSGAAIAHHVERRPYLSHRVGVVLQNLRDAEVSDFHHIPGADKHVCGLDVSVDNLLRVEALNPSHALDDVLPHDVFWNVPTLLLAYAKQPVLRDTFHVYLCSISR